MTEQELYNEYRKSDFKSFTDFLINKIVQLEQKLEQTENDLADYQFNYPKIKELEKDKCELLGIIQGKDKAIQDLQKENAELKAEIENDRDLPTVAYMQGAENQKKKDEKQLTKAKELIEKLISLNRKEWVYSDVREEAEQFLKEIEK